MEGSWLKNSVKIARIDFGVGHTGLVMKKEYQV